jgi:tetratricopeptide (TPR) repeat protein
MAALGVLYADGNGVARDYNRAREWYEKAAAAGSVDAMYYLIELYENGRGVARDYDKARKWYEKAITRSDPSAGNLIDLIAQGKLVAEIRGSDIGSVVLRVRRISRDPDPDPLFFNVPLGTFFTAANSSSQNMVVIAPRLLRLANAKWLSISIPTACANMTRKIPNAKDRFTAGLLSDRSDLSHIITVLYYEDAAPNVVQAAVWIITDNATFDGLGTLVDNKTHSRTIGADDAARAMKFIADAGIEIDNYDIWKIDRFRLSTMVMDKPLAGWLLTPPLEIDAATRSLIVRTGLEVDPTDNGRQYTRAGRALQKHANRSGSVFVKAEGAPDQWNQMGQKVLEEIVTSNTSQIKTGNRFGGIDIVAQDGRGARFDGKGTFKGFLEPNGDEEP